MICIVCRFPGRRYHATPAGHHVNEGVVEWPPSPWRLLRALISTGYTKLGWTVVPQVAHTLVDRLASTLPSYRVPPAVAAHSRHYMPLGTLEKGREKTTLVFDTWVEVGAGELWIVWDVELLADELELLRQLVRDLGYLGRAEGWVDARLEPGPPPGDTPGDSAVFPCDGAPRPGPAWEQIALLAPEPQASYSAWRAERAATQTQAEGKKARSTARAAAGKRGKRVAGSGGASSPYPDDILACLQVDTRWLDANGWNQPPGSRRVLYWRRRDAVEAGAPRLDVSAPAARPVQAMLLALATPSGNLHALPPVARTLPQAELFHRALVSHIARIAPSRHATVTGKGDDGTPLAGHKHLHVLPLDLDSDGHLDHILVWAPIGLDGAAQDAVRAVRRTFMKGGVGELRVVLAGAGSLAEMRAVPGKLGDELRRTLGPSAGSRVWESETPFVPPRHAKARGTNTFEGQVLAELDSRGLPVASAVDVLDPKSERGAAMRHFVRVRRRGPSPPGDFGLACRLEFESPVPGPLCLGYGSHFGLGRFAAVDDPGGPPGPPDSTMVPLDHDR